MHTTKNDIVFHFDILEAYRGNKIPKIQIFKFSKTMHCQIKENTGLRKYHDHSFTSKQQGVRQHQLKSGIP